MYTVKKLLLLSIFPADTGSNIAKIYIQYPKRTRQMMPVLLEKCRHIQNAESLIFSEKNITIKATNL